jgi:hypothetical protein
MTSTAGVLAKKTVREWRNAPLRRDGVEFVKEQDTRLGSSGSLEQVSDLCVVLDQFARKESNNAPIFH